MATLYFKVSSDYDEVIRLRQECEKLETQLLKMDKRKSPAAVAGLETQLAATRQQMMGLVTEAAKAGAVMERDFRNGIYNASQTVNDLTQKIIDQKKVVKDVEFDVKRLGNAYQTALKRNPFGATDQLSEYKAAKKALEEEKAVLFGLTQQQAEARLSVKKLKDEYSAFKEEAGETVKANENMSLSLTKVLGVIGGATALKRFASEIIRVRGEFQAMETAIETLVGKEMSDKLIPQIKELAKISPLTMSDMVGAEKMMLGFNIQAEDTIRYLQALSDISMGDSVKFNSLTLAFSQMSAAGKLMGQDLNQMINAGFNPLQVISEKTGKSIATLKDEMSKGAVSAEMVQQAFIDATSAGGKFYQMSENASKTINGQISMMQDALDAAFNEIGQASEGVIMKGIQATTSLIRNYETVGKVLIGLVVTYGTYRTAVMLATMATSKHTMAEITLTNVRILARKAQLALNASMLTNPYVAVATVLTGLIVTMWAFHDSTTTTEAANKSLADTLEGVKQKEKEHKETIEELINKATDEKNATNERNDALKSLVVAYPSIIKKYIDEEGHLTNIIALKKEIAELDSQKSIMTLGQKVSKNQEYVNFLRNVKSGKVNLHSDKSLLNWYTSLEERALKSYSGRSALTIDEMIAFYERKQKGLTDTYNRSKTEDKINKLASGLKDDTDEKLNDLLNSRKQLLSQFTNKIGYVYDAAIKDYVKKTDVEAQISQIEGIQTSRKKGKDKAYWEKKNKEAKAKLEALDVSQKGSDLWNKYTKEIEDSQQKIDLYSVSKSNSAELKEVKQENQVTSQSSKLAEIEKKQALDRAREAVDMENQIEQARIDAMANGGDKILAQRELNNKKEMQAIDRAKEEYIQKEVQRQKEIFEATEDLKAKQNPKYKKRSFDSSSVTVDTSSFDILKENTDKRQVQEDLNAQREAMNAYLAEYGTYMQKRQAIIEQYQDKINKAATEGEKLTLGKQRDSILSGIDEQANRTTSAVSLLFGDMKDKTLKDLEAINIAGQKALEFLKSGRWDETTGKELGITKENFDVWSNDPEKIKAISDALVNNRKAADDLQPAYKKVAAGIKDAFDAGNDSKKLEEALARIRDGMNEIMQVGSFLSDTFSSLGGAFGNDTFTGIADGINVAMDAMNSAMQGAQAGSMFGPIGAAAGAAIGVVTSLVTSIAKIHDSKNEKNIEKLQDQIDVLDDSYNKLARSIEKAYSTDASDLIDQQNELLEQQKLLIQQQILEEKDKKKTDDGRIKEWEQQLKDIDEQILDNVEKAQEAIAGISFDSFRNNFLDSLSDMDAKVEDFADNFEEYLKKAILNGLMAEKYDSQIKELYEKWTAYGKDGLTEAEVEQLRKDYKDIASAMIADRDSLAQIYGWEGESSKEQQSASSRGFGSEMTHEDAGELSGRFTAVYESNLRIEAAEQQHTVAITELRGSISALTAQASGMYNIADETRTILANSYLELQQIRENTGEIVKPIKQMQADMAEVKRNTSRL